MAAPLETVKVYIASFFSFWQIARLLCVVALIAVVIIPIRELRALSKTVVYFNAANATIEWDPPDEGLVDHYVLEITTSSLGAEPQNIISWVEHVTTDEPRYTLSTADGHNYNFKVKAVGVNGEESPYADRDLTLICDCSPPEVIVKPFQTNGAKIRSRDLSLTGRFRDDNIASVTINGQKVKLDLAAGTWSVTLPLQEGENQIYIEARDYAGNVKSQKLAVWHQPLVFKSEPADADLSVMGTPAYPGIFIGKTPFKFFGSIDPSLQIPLSIRKTGHTGLNALVSFAPEQDEISFAVPTLAAPQRFKRYEVPLPDASLAASGLLYPFALGFHGDEALNLLVGSSSGHIMLVHAARTDDEFRSELVPLPGENGEPLVMELESAPFMIDFDDDFSYDLVVGGKEDTLTVLSQAEGMWTVRKQLKVDSSIFLNGFSFWFVDWNSDHRKDLLIANDRAQVEVLLNSATDEEPHFGPESILLSVPDLKKGSPVAIADWDGDGSVDILAQDVSGSLSVWLNSGSQKSAYYAAHDVIVTSDELNATTLSSSVLDFNRDGAYEVIVGTDTGRLFLLEGLKE